MAIELYDGARCKNLAGDIVTVKKIENPYLFVDENEIRYTADGRFSEGHGTEDVCEDIIEILPPVLTLEASKMYPLKNGHMATLYGQMPDGRWIGYFVNRNGIYSPEAWDEHGRYIPGRESDYDIAPPAPPVRKNSSHWANIYPSMANIYPGMATLYVSRSIADKMAAPNRVACVPVTISWTFGEGLDASPAKS